MSSSETEQIGQNFNILWMADVLYQNRWLIAGCTALFLFIAAVYCVITPRIYSADAAVQVESSKDGLLDLDVLTNISGGPVQSAVEIELLKSRWLIGKTINDLKLDFDANPDTFPIFGAYLARRYQDEFPDELAAPPVNWLAHYNWGGAKIELDFLEAPIDLIDEELTLIALGDNAFELYFDGELLGRGVVGELFEAGGVSFKVLELRANQNQQFTLVKKDTLAVIAGIRSRLSIVERGRSTGFLNISFQGKSPERTRKVVEHLTNYYLEQNKARLAEVASTSLAFLQGQLPVIREDMERAAKRLNEYQTNNSSVNVDIETKSVLEQLVAVDSALSQSRIRQVDIERRYTANHPEFRAHLQQQRELEKRKAEIEKQVHDLPTTQQDVLRLTRDVEVATQIYLMMLSKAQELDILRAGTVGSVRLIDETVIDLLNPVYPKIPLVLLIGCILGVGTGLIVSVLRAVFFSRITNVAEIENLNLKIFGNIPLSILQKNLERSWTKKNIEYGRPILTNESRFDNGIEAFKSLRTSMHFHLLATQAKVIAITGPNPNIGKSFAAVNLSMVFAQTGRKVLLIDADLRKGYLHQFFDKETTKNQGLAGVLAGKIELEAALQATSEPCLTLLPRGPIPNHPSELLMGERLESVISTLRGMFDLIIIDTPPVMAVSDALIISQYADASLTVARFGYNRVTDIQKTVKAYAGSGLKIDGVILNGSYKTLVNMQHGEYGYYAYYVESNKNQVS